MKKVLLVLIMNISAYSINAQTTVYNHTAVVNGRFYSSSGIITVNTTPVYRPVFDWDWDIETKAKRNGFYKVDTVKKIIYYLDKEFKYDTAMYDVYSTGIGGKIKNAMYAGKEGYISVMDEPLTIRRQMFTVWVNGRKELYHLK